MTNVRALTEYRQKWQNPFPIHFNWTLLDPGFFINSLVFSKRKEIHLSLYSVSKNIYPSFIPYFLLWFLMLFHSIFTQYLQHELDLLGLIQWLCSSVRVLSNAETNDERFHCPWIFYWFVSPCKISVVVALKRIVPEIPSQRRYLYKNTQ